MDMQVATEFPDALAWLNLAQPLRMWQLRGKPAVLAFASPGSAWSQQALQDLSRLQARHPGRVQCVAILVPRFDHERERRRAEHAMSRGGYDFPVALDDGWQAWQQMDVHAWPTLLLLDAEGVVRDRITGLCAPRELDARVATLFVDNAPEGQIALRHVAQPTLPLRYPAGIAVDANYLYVADSGHHRILECDHAGRVLRQFGSGDPGFLDGPRDLSAFQRPHALSLQRDVLYVADAGNHAVRRIRLRTGDTETLCGSGYPGMTQPGPVRDPRACVLDMPQAIAATGDGVVVACAGDNRVWYFDLGSGELRLVAGSGRLAVADGSDFSAAFAQPAGLAAVQQLAYVCDSAGSAIRSVNLRSGRVATLVGRDAWEFGQQDGARGDARLQQPLAVALDADAPVLWIADAGNDALRSLRLGGGELGTYALRRPLHGPAGLACSPGMVWIADTDAHAILRVVIATGELHHVPVGE